MAVTAQRTVYDFAEALDVQSEGTTVVNVWAIPAGTLIERVIAVVKTVGTGTANVTVGDDDDADGFIIAYDHTSAVGTVFGDVMAEVGAYLKMACGATNGYSLCNKLYVAAGKTVRLVLSGAGTIQGIHTLYIIGKRFAV
jgi:hypothetical protein